MNGAFNDRELAEHEYRRLAQHYDELREFINSDQFEKVGDGHSYLLSRQLFSMRDYLDVLKATIDWLGRQNEQQSS